MKDESVYLVAYQTALDTFDETLKNKIGLYELDDLKVLLQQLRCVSNNLSRLLSSKASLDFNLSWK